MGILELIGVLIAAFIFGGAWHKGKQAKAQKEADRKAAERIRKVKDEADNDFSNKPDAARKWLRKRK